MQNHKYSLTCITSVRAGDKKVIISENSGKFRQNLNSQSRQNTPVPTTDQPFYYSNASHGIQIIFTSVHISTRLSGPTHAWMV